MWLDDFCAAIWELFAETFSGGERPSHDAPELIVIDQVNASVAGGLTLVLSFCRHF
jgi:hypothetical protein